jgi:tyrosinase
MLISSPAVTRLHFLRTTIAAVGAASLPLGDVAAAPSAKYTRCNVMSEGGKKALASYAKGIEAMLKLPANHPQNWFHNAFVHLLDCPHGNWWFYVWHRGYLGYFEQSIRNLSGDDKFAFPYWDWTTLPQIPDPMFDGLLNPHNAAFEPYTRDLAVFTAFAQPALKSYWNNLTSDQLVQLKTRGYADFDALWNDVTGFDPHQTSPHGVSGNIAYANPCGSRYLTRDNPKLDEKTAYNVSEFVVYSGLLPTDFYNPEPDLSFNSSKTTSHNAQPGRHSFSVLEGLPHNKVHNYIGGVGPIDPGPYGYMTNFLSPLDPIFFLHHANIDRLWDVWTRKQKRLNLPYLPTGKDLESLSNEPFLFYVDDKGQYVGGRAGDYLSMEKFEYDYEPGFGEKIVGPASIGPTEKPLLPPIKGTVKGNTALLAISPETIKKHLASDQGVSPIAEITLPHPDASSIAREFDVVVGAPADVTQVGADSPYYAGTIAFFGNMMRMEGSPTDATFAVPLPRAPEAFHAFVETKNALLNVRILPAQGRGEKVPALKSASIRAL